MANLSKKTKPKSRFSGFVSRMQIQSPKRGSSLVVETGFPTSLIDLFVKNRDRLKMMKKKAKTTTTAAQMKISEPILISSPPVELPAPEECVIEGETLREGDDSGVVIGGIKAVEMLKKDEINVKGGDDDFGCSKSVFVHVLKMFFVVVLGLCTRKLAVGITLSAVLLVFFESCCVFKSRFFRRRDDVNVSGSDGAGLGDSVEEIQVVGRRDGSGGGVEGIGRLEGPAMGRDCSSGEVVEERVIKEMIEEDGAEFSKDKKKAKRFIKKIVKRLKTVKKKKGKEGDVKSDEVYSCKYESIEEKCDEAQEEEDGGGERFSISSQEHVSSKGQKEQSEIPSSGELCRADAEIPIGEENVGKGRRKNSGYLILFLVVLAGLLGGRVMGLGITIAWCIMVKFVCKLRGHVDEPVLRSSVLNLS